MSSLYNSSVDFNVSPLYSTEEASVSTIKIPSCCTCVLLIYLYEYEINTPRQFMYSQPLRRGDERCEGTDDSGFDVMSGDDLCFERTTAGSLRVLCLHQLFLVLSSMPVHSLLFSGKVYTPL